MWWCVCEQNLLQTDRLSNFMKIAIPNAAIKIGRYKQCLANGVHEELDCGIYREQLLA